jgi:hypothetical protein
MINNTISIPLWIKTRKGQVYLAGLLLALILSIFGGWGILLLYAVFAPLSILAGIHLKADNIAGASLYMGAVVFWLLPWMLLVTEFFLLTTAPSLNLTRPTRAEMRIAHHDDVSVDYHLTDVDTTSGYFVARINLRVQNNHAQWSYRSRLVACEFENPPGFRLHYIVTGNIAAQQDIETSYRLHTAQFPEARVPRVLAIRACEAGRDRDHAYERLNARLQGAR